MEKMEVPDPTVAVAKSFAVVFDRNLIASQSSYRVF